MKQDNDLTTISNEPIKVLGKLATTVTYNEWTCEEASLTVVEDRHKLIIGRSLFDSLGLAVVQHVLTILIFQIKIKETIVSQFPPLVSRIGLSKTHVVKSQLHQEFIAKHQKSRRVPINLQPRVTVELDRLQKEGHIEKFFSCSDEHFIFLIIITVMKDQSIKLALDSKVF